MTAPAIMNIWVKCPFHQSLADAFLTFPQFHQRVSLFLEYTSKNYSFLNVYCLVGIVGVFLRQGTLFLLGHTQEVHISPAEPHTIAIATILVYLFLILSRTYRSWIVHTHAHHFSGKVCKTLVACNHDISLTASVFSFGE